MFITRLLRNWFGGSKISDKPRRDTSRLSLESLEDRTTPAAINALVPAYFYPTPGGGWDQLAASAQKIGITAILNPDSGPGVTVDSNYVAAVNKLQAAGGKVVGYIHTSYASGAVSLATVETEINEYRSWYHVNGIFIDEMSNDGTGLQYDASIYQYAHGTQANFTVIGNPGSITTQAYATTPVADVLVNFEDTGANYSSFMPPSWQANYPANRFANIVYGVSSVAAMRADVSQAAQHNNGYLYVTDGTDTASSGYNPYASLPSYWNQFVAALQSTPIVAPTPVQPPPVVPPVVPPAPVATATHVGLSLATTTPTAGKAFSVTLTALDRNGNRVTSYNGPVTITASDGQPVYLSPGSVTLVNGSAAFTVTLNRADSLNLQASAGSIQGASTLRVSPAAVASVTISAPTAVYHGASFSIGLTIKDGYGNTVTLPAGTLTLTSTDPQAARLGSYSVANGATILTIPRVSLRTAGRQTITFTFISATESFRFGYSLTVI